MKQNKQYISSKASWLLYSTVYSLQSTVYNPHLRFRETLHRRCDTNLYQLVQITALCSSHESWFMNSWYYLDLLTSQFSAREIDSSLSFVNGVSWGLQHSDPILCYNILSQYYATVSYPIVHIKVVVIEVIPANWVERLLSFAAAG